MTTSTRPRPRLSTGHSTLAARDLQALKAFYCDVLGFEVTNEGPIPTEGQELVFLSQDPSAHHQIAMVGGAMTSDSDFVMVDHLAFRTGSLDDLRVISDEFTDGLQNHYSAEFMVLKDSPIKTVDDLKGKSVAVNVRALISSAFR